MSSELFDRIGAMLAEKGKFESAAATFGKALAFDPSRNDIRSNRADMLRRLWRFDEAEADIIQAMSKGNFEKANFIAGCLYYDMAEPVKALEYLTPSACMSPYGRFVRSQALLLAGQYREGFEEHEGRLDMFPDHPSPIPQWKGESLEGKTLAIHHEQGFGDTFAHFRFIARLWDQHSPDDILLGLPSPLMSLLDEQGMLAKVFCMNEPLPDADYVVPMMSLAHRLSLDDISTPGPYISPHKRFDIPVAPDARHKVGIVWRAKSGQSSTDVSVNLHGERKSIPLAMFLPLAAIPGVQLYSLQTGDAEGDIAEANAEHLVHNLGNRVTTFDDLASFVQEMDVIVTVDTAPMHLAAAMGKPVIALVNYSGGWPFPLVGDWQNRTPWYSSIELIRQQKPFEWGPVMEQVARKLA